MNFHMRTQRLERLQREIKTKIERTQGFRLVSFFIFFALLTLSIMQPEWRIEAPVILIFLGLFIPLLVRTRKLKSYLKDLTLYREFCERQDQRKTGNPRPAPIYGEIDEPRENQSLSKDLHLFGSNSLFHMIDETFTEGGMEKLSHRILNPSLSTEGIQIAQKRIKELAASTWSLTRFILLGRKSQERISSSDILWFLNKPMLQENFSLHFMGLWGLWIVSILHTVLFLTQMVSLSPMITYALFVLYSLMTLDFGVQALTRLQNISLSLNQLAPIFYRLEASPFSQFHFLKEIHQNNPHKRLRRAETMISLLSTQAHPIIHIIINGVFPWTLTWSFFSEKLRKDLQKNLPLCLDELYELEVEISLAILYRYQTQTFPKITDDLFELKEVYHPLISREQVVKNDFALNFSSQRGQLVLITGSNMSGKSTFLRTLGVNQQLALMGAPVFATQMNTVLAPVLSCIQVSDSIEDGISYFYAEVLKLKELINSAKEKRSLFFIDEIFRGTNNRERLIGSQAVLKALIGTESFGFVSTHDLELAQLDQTEKNFYNFHFHDLVKDGKMYFDYQIQKGPCTSTNAIKIMSEAGLPIE